MISDAARQYPTFGVTATLQDKNLLPRMDSNHEPAG